MKPTRHKVGEKVWTLRRATRLPNNDAGLCDYERHTIWIRTGGLATEIHEFIHAAIPQATEQQVANAERAIVLAIRRDQRRRRDARYQASEKGKARQARYSQSAKAKQRARRYETTVKAAARRRRYDNTTKGILRSVRANAKNRRLPQ